MSTLPEETPAVPDRRDPIRSGGRTDAEPTHAHAAGQTLGGATDTGAYSP